MKKTTYWMVWVAVSVGLSACGAERDPVAGPADGIGDECPESGCEDLEVGQVEADQKTDGIWTEALKCKPIPALEPLKDPEIIVSLDGLTFRLIDRAGDYEEVFAIGPGAIDGKGESLTPTSTHLPGGVFYARADKPAAVDNTREDRAVWAWNYSCRIWGKGLPYFAGLPFIRLEGTGPAVYGFHGPIDKFTKEEGGELRRGFVSHGCIRMAAADIVEVFALIQGHKVPVRIQKAIDRTAEGIAVDVEDNWLLGECQQDADCRFEGGVCHQNAWSGRGFCTSKCEGICGDKPGYPTSRCVVDPDVPEEGICLPQSDPTTHGCGRYESFAEVSVPAFGTTSTFRDVCVPGPDGWLGSRCIEETDCGRGRCVPFSEEESTSGVCAEGCTRFCPDTEGAPSTFCVEDTLKVTEDLGGMCAATCVQSEDCPLGFGCQEAARFGQPERAGQVCLPL